MILNTPIDMTSQKRAEAALRESEQIFRTLAESSPNMIFINQDGRIIYANKRCVEVTGYTLEELYHPQFKFMTLVAPAFRETVAKMYQLHSAGVEVPQEEYAVITKDGRQIKALYGSRLISYQEKPAILGTITKITKRERVEAALRKSEAQLKDAQALGRIGNWEFDIATQKITWSDQTFRLYDRDPALGPPTPQEEAEYYSPEQQRRLQEYVCLAKAEGKSFQYDFEAMLKSGAHVFFSATMQPITDDEGRVVKLFGTVQDITNRRIVEEQLRQMNQFLDSIIENIPLIISVKDARSLSYLRVNRTFEQAVKLKQSEIVGKTLEQFSFPFQSFPVNTAENPVPDKDVILEKKIRVFKIRDTQTGRIFECKKIPLLNAAGEVIYLLGITEDVTEQLKVEQERQALLEKTLQISDLKSNLITQAAHELKTPLTSIIGWSELLFNAKKQGKSIDSLFDIEDIETILRNAERLNDLVNDFLDVGRIENGKFGISKQSISFEEIIENAIRAVDYLATQKHITISTPIGIINIVSVDRRRMEQVIINLLSNAIKYSPDNTRVKIHTGLIDLSGQNLFQVQVIDEGYGFTPEELPEATTPFGKAYTRQDQKRVIQGTGLGLFISRRIVEQHGGTLEIHSEGVNKGTRVEILLPLE